MKTATIAGVAQIVEFLSLIREKAWLTNKVYLRPLRSGDGKLYSLWSNDRA